MFLAAKVEEIVAPLAINFLYCADSSYTEAEILQAEKYILKMLEWSMNYPNPIYFLRRVSKADKYDVQVRTVAKYFLEIECVEWRLIAAPPSLLAAASMWLARFVLRTLRNLDHVYDSRFYLHTIPTHITAVLYVIAHWHRALITLLHFAVHF
jgi:G2/mitotic-specific cyclin 1/2